MPSVCGIPMPERKRACRENYLRAVRSRESEHDYLMRTNPDYRAACEQEDLERKRRVENMTGRVEITGVEIAGVTAKRLCGNNSQTEGDTMADKPDRNTKVTRPIVGEFKGHPTLTLPNGSKYGFTFGLGKARAILDNLDAIRAFVGEEQQQHEDASVAAYVSAGLGENVDFCPSDSQEGPF